MDPKHLEWMNGDGFHQFNYYSASQVEVDEDLVSSDPVFGTGGLERVPIIPNTQPQGDF
jgi:hypothetical protein